MEFMVASRSSNYPLTLLMNGWSWLMINYGFMHLLNSIPSYLVTCQHL